MRRDLPPGAALVVAAGLLCLVVACAAEPAPSPSRVPTPAQPRETLETSVFFTGYTWHDNTPPGDAISQPTVLHGQAGGTGTWDDPITVAVGHSLATGRDVLDYPAGTRLYVPYLRRYLIVEDTCGDGPEPEDAPCHRLDDPDNPAPDGAVAWLDVWLDGRDQDEATAHRCARRLTGLHSVVFNAAPGYLVADGEGILQDDHCDIGYGEEIETE